MNTNETKQLQALLSAVDRLDKVTKALERRLITLETHTKKVTSALSAAKVRIASLSASLDSVKSHINRQ
jgi:predicted  nucleic acid-binding Zn-ribbon protein